MGQGLGWAAVGELRGLGLGPGGGSGPGEGEIGLHVRADWRELGAPSSGRVRVGNRLLDVCALAASEVACHASAHRGTMPTADVLPLASRQGHHRPAMRRPEDSGRAPAVRDPSRPTLGVTAAGRPSRRGPGSAVQELLSSPSAKADAQASRGSAAANALPGRAEAEAWPSRATAPPDH